MVSHVPPSQNCQRHIFPIIHPSMEVICEILYVVKHSLTHNLLYNVYLMIRIVNIKPEFSIGKVTDSVLQSLISVG